MLGVSFGMVNVPLKESTAETFTRRASAEGLTLPEYLDKLAALPAPNGRASTQTDLLPSEEIERRIRLMQEWFASHKPRPTLADDSRESIY